MSSTKLHVVFKFKANSEDRQSETMLYYLIYRMDRVRGQRFQLVNSANFEAKLNVAAGKVDVQRDVVYHVPNHQGSAARCLFFSQCSNIFADVACDLVTELNCADVTLARTAETSLGGEPDTYALLKTIFGTTVQPGVDFVIDREAAHRLSKTMGMAVTTQASLNGLQSTLASISDTIRYNQQNLQEQIAGLQRTIQGKELEKLREEIGQGPLPVPFPSFQDAEEFLALSDDNYDCVRGVIGHHEAVVRERTRAQKARNDRTNKNIYFPAGTLLGALFKEDAIRSMAEADDVLPINSLTCRLLTERARHVMGPHWLETDYTVRKKYIKNIHYRNGKEVPEELEEPEAPKERTKKRRKKCNSCD